jgi:hypothetical protein
MKTAHGLLILGIAVALVGCATPNATSARWEYKTIEIHPFVNVESQLNALGMEGWELTENTGNGGYILKRKLQ